MNHRFRAGVFVACLLSVGRVSAADPPYVPIEARVPADALDAIGLRPDQLARLNELLEAAERAAPPGILPPRPSVQGAPGMLAGLDEAPLDAHVRGTVAGWEPGTVFRLDNGQEWTVLKGRARLRRPVGDPAVRLVPGLAGRWFLEVDEDLPKARVYRSD